jgi:Phage tail repeat like
MQLPSNMATGTFVGQWLVMDVDGTGPAPGAAAPACAGVVTFSPRVPYLPDATAVPNPVTVVGADLVGILDAEGFLCTPDPDSPDLPGVRGLSLVSSDDPAGQVEDWTWHVTYQFTNTSRQIPAHDAYLPTGAVIDLTTVMKVPSSPGLGTEQAESLVAAAVALVSQALAIVAGATQDPNPLTIPVRDGAGHLKAVQHVATGPVPTQAGHTTRKDYVDAGDAARALKIHRHTYGDIDGLVPTSALPPLAIIDTFTPASQAAMLALNAQRGDMAIRTDTSLTFVLAADDPTQLGNWKQILAAGQVTSVAGKTGTVALAKADVGLSNADNTADNLKPVSAATQTALNGKSNTGHTHTITDVTGLQARLDAYNFIGSNIYTATTPVESFPMGVTLFYGTDGTWPFAFCGIKTEKHHASGYGTYQTATDNTTGTRKARIYKQTGAAWTAWKDVYTP